MINRKHTIFVLAACMFLTLQGCSSSQAPSSQPPATQPNQSTPVQPASPTGDTSQVVTSIDLSRELTINPSIVVGKTTLAEMIKAYGKPEKLSQTESNFHTDIEEKKEKAPAIKELFAMFKVNPITGKPSENLFPLYFTTRGKSELVASPVLLNRGDLLEKLKNKSIKMADIRKVYGEPNREIEGAIEYYDFNHKISLMVVEKNGNIITMLTKYDLLYGSNQKDMQLHEKIIKVEKQAPSK